MGTHLFGSPCIWQARE